ncbi:MAG: hypothetical protein PUP91_15325 [Rhizonema sp. PD37]|nr:hypothetical protein [Rhizonema sp. PD37]
MISKVFLLQWKNPAGDNIRLPKEDELIVIRQHAHVTHIVKLFNNTLYDDSSGSEFNLGRLIQVVWIANDFKNLPNYQEVFSCPIVFPPDGKVHLLENNSYFKEYWDKHGGFLEFQDYVKGVLDKYGEFKELLVEL